MDLLLKDLNSGFLPVNYKKNVFRSLPSNMDEKVEEHMQRLRGVL